MVYNRVRKRGYMATRNKQSNNRTLVGVWLTDSELAKLDAMSKVSRSQTIRILIEAAYQFRGN
jgi:alanine-alpha-ketoisovalerate/valine-pyruvate aminotransferase